MPWWRAWPLLAAIAMAALGSGAFLAIRELTGDGPRLVAVDPGHRERLAENIAFFEGRAHELSDHLSYNRLTALYLQRLRETGDVSDIRRAEISATRSLEILPGDYTGLLNLALVRLAQHEFAAAERLADEARVKRPALPDAHAVLGDAQFALGKYEPAIASYGVYLERAPGFAALTRQAAVAELRGDVPLARQFWEAAIEGRAAVEPENAAWARVQLGNLLFATGSRKEARSLYDTALQTFPRYPAALAGLARVAAADGDDRRAIALYQQATAAAPTPEAAAELAAVLDRAGRPEEARQQRALLGAIQQLYDAAGVRSELSLILYALDHGVDPAATLERARIAYEERPAVAAADVYAWALYRTDRLDDARKRAEEALRFGTKEPLPLFHAGIIAAAQGDDAAARGYLRAALDLNPRFSVLHAPTASDTLRKLEPAR